MIYIFLRLEKSQSGNFLSTVNQFKNKTNLKLYFLGIFIINKYFIGI
jgi:hypothetical protein